MSNADPYDLHRFVSAQDGIYSRVKAELTASRKRSHWMWFVFPQAEGLGSSYTSRHYAIRSADEARAYLDHPVLGHRLRELSTIVLAHADVGAEEIFGQVDAIKFRSSMTLFAEVSTEDAVFGNALEAFYAGRRDERTLAWLARCQDQERT